MKVIGLSTEGRVIVHLFTSSLQPLGILKSPHPNPLPKGEGTNDRTHERDRV
jgi:hypothetical protein